MEDYSQEYTFSRFEEACAQYPDNDAVIFLGQRFTYRRLKELADRFAAGLDQRGIKKGDRVLLYLSNSPQLIIAWLASQKIGAVLVLVSPIYTSHELAYMIEDSGAKSIICHDTNYGYVREILADSGLEHVIVTSLLDLVSPVKRAVAAMFDKAPTGKVKGGPETVWFKKLLASPPNPPAVEIDPIEDLSYILYTGGTTGFPKGVPGNHWGHCSYVADIMAQVFAGHVRPGQDTYIAVNPLFHIMALGLLMALGLNQGNTTILMPQPQVDAILEAIQRYQVRWMLGVPALYRMILENDRQATYDLGSVKYCYCGGDVLPREVLTRWKERVGVSIYQVYGSTEAGHVTYSRLDDGEPPAMSVGKPLASRRCILVDPDTLEPTPPGELGELLVTSEHAVKHYLNKPEETADAFVQIQDEVYYRTRDYLKQDDDGQLYYVERSADILKHKGYRVSASEIEAVLQDHPTVVGACVVGVPDKKVGERIKAIVVMKEDAKGVGAAELLRFCRDRLASYKVPSYIEFRDMLPKSKVGKLLRREIRDEERRRQEKEKQVTGGPQAAGSEGNRGGEANMEFQEVLKLRRSCRAFSENAVSDEQLDQLIEACTWAPSPLHLQPWSFVVVRDPAVKAKVIEVSQAAKQAVIDRGGPDWVQKYGFGFLEQAPVLLVVCSDPKKGGLGAAFGRTDGAMQGVSAGIQNLMLAAADMGLGTLWFTFFEPGAMKEALGVPAELDIAAVIPVGVPAGQDKAPPRKSPKVFQNQYGT